MISPTSVRLRCGRVDRRGRPPPRNKSLLQLPVKNLGPLPDRPDNSTSTISTRQEGEQRSEHVEDSDRYVSFHRETSEVENVDHVQVHEHDLADLAPGERLFRLEQRAAAAQKMDAVLERLVLRVRGEMEIIDSRADEGVVTILATSGANQNPTMEPGEKLLTIGDSDSEDEHRSAPKKMKISEHNFLEVDNPLRDLASCLLPAHRDEDFWEEVGEEEFHESIRDWARLVGATSPDAAGGGSPPSRTKVLLRYELRLREDVDRDHDAPGGAALPYFTPTYGGIEVEVDGAFLNQRPLSLSQNWRRKVLFVLLKNYHCAQRAQRVLASAATAAWPGSAPSTRPPPAFCNFVRDAWSWLKALLRKEVKISTSSSRSHEHEHDEEEDQAQGAATVDDHEVLENGLLRDYRPEEAITKAAHAWAACQDGGEQVLSDAELGLHFAEVLRELLVKPKNFVGDAFVSDNSSSFAYPARLTTIGLEFPNVGDEVLAAARLKAYYDACVHDYGHRQNHLKIKDEDQHDHDDEGSSTSAAPLDGFLLRSRYERFGGYENASFSPSSVLSPDYTTFSADNRHPAVVFLNERRLHFVFERLTLQQFSLFYGQKLYRCLEREIELSTIDDQLKMKARGHDGGPGGSSGGGCFGRELQHQATGQKLSRPDCSSSSSSAKSCSTSGSTSTSCVKELLKTKDGGGEKWRDVVSNLRDCSEGVFAGGVVERLMRRYELLAALFPEEPTGADDDVFDEDDEAMARASSSSPLTLAKAAARLRRDLLMSYEEAVLAVSGRVSEEEVGRRSPREEQHASSSSLKKCVRGAGAGSLEKADEEDDLLANEDDPHRERERSVRAEDSEDHERNKRGEEGQGEGHEERERSAASPLVKDDEQEQHHLGAFEKILLGGGKFKQLAQAFREQGAEGAGRLEHPTRRYTKGSTASSGNMVYRVIAYARGCRPSSTPNNGSDRQAFILDVFGDAGLDEVCLAILHLWHARVEYRQGQQQTRSEKENGTRSMSRGQRGEKMTSRARVRLGAMKHSIVDTYENVECCVVRRSFFPWSQGSESKPLLFVSPSVNRSDECSSSTPYSHQKGRDLLRGHSLGRKLYSVINRSSRSSSFSPPPRKKRRVMSAKGLVVPDEEEEEENQECYGESGEEALSGDDVLGGQIRVGKKNGLTEWEVEKKEEEQIAMEAENEHQDAYHQRQSSGLGSACTTMGFHQSLAAQVDPPRPPRKRKKSPTGVFPMAGATFSDLVSGPASLSPAGCGARSLGLGGAQRTRSLLSSKTGSLLFFSSTVARPFELHIENATLNRGNSASPEDLLLEKKENKVLFVGATVPLENRCEVCRYRVAELVLRVPLGGGRRLYSGGREKRLCQSCLEALSPVRDEMQVYPLKQ